MILQNNSQTRIFNGKGFEHEISLILNLFNKYNGIYNLMKIIKTHKLISLDITKILGALNSYFFFKLKNLIVLKQTFILKLLNLFARFFFINVFKLKLENNLKLSLFLNLKNILKAKDISSSFYGKRKKEILNNLFFLVSNKKNKKYLLQNKYYNYNFIKPRRNFLKTYQNKNNHNIFISGEVFGFYQGSITPFSKSNLSWFISTGLKGDVECNELDLFKYILQEETPTFHDSKIKDVIFKVKNFQNKVNSKIKKNVRHLLFYKTNQFFGFQRFFSESKVSFNFFQISEFNFQFHRLLNLNRNIKNFFFDNLKLDKRYFGLFLKQTKIAFIYFKLSRTLLNFFFLLTRKRNSLVIYSTYFSKSLILFKYISTRFILVFKMLFTKNIFLLKGFFLDHVLKTKIKKFNFLQKKNAILLQTFFLNFNFTKGLIKNIGKITFLQHFFSIFLHRKERYSLIKKLIYEDLTLTNSEKANIYIRLLRKPYKFLIYRLFLYYFYFLIDWKLNFIILMNTNEFLQYKRSYGFTEILKPFITLKKRWEFDEYINPKELYRFFYIFLEEMMKNLKIFFYTSFLFNKKKDINFKFLASNLFIYLSKLTIKDTEEDFFLVNNFVRLSDFFLGKWFYYRQKNKFLDNISDYHYDLFNSSKVLNFSQKENYLYNLTKLNFAGMEVSSKLNYYFKNSIQKPKVKASEKDKILFVFKSAFERLNRRLVFYSKTRKGFLKKKKIKRFMTRLNLVTTQEILININNYRKYRWSKKFSESSLNSLDIGFNFKLPLIKKGKHILKTRKYIHKFAHFRKLTKNRLRKIFINFYKDNYLKEEEFLLTNTFLCTYTKTKTIKKIKSYSKLFFWFNK